MFSTLKLEILQIESNKKTLRSFGLTVGGVFLAGACFVVWRNYPNISALTIAFISFSILLILLGLIAPYSLKWLQKIWMGIAVVMGFFMTKLILSFFFYFILSPFGIIRRMMGKDDMKRRWDKNAKSYWQPKTYHDKSTKRLEKYF
jgi:multisubunit Na+/H+ antiporter MnhG subunit